MVITDECISCQACIDECSKDAIFDAGDSYELNGETKDAISDDHTFIVPELCEDCKDCVEVCAVDAIVEG